MLLSVGRVYRHLDFGWRVVQNLSPVDLVNPWLLLGAAAKIHHPVVALGVQLVASLG